MMAELDHPILPQRKIEAVSMKLKCAQVREFRSIWDSDPFEVDRVACFVGKNESGKTALLHALHRLNPIDDDRPNGFDVTDDYPRSHVEEYEQALEGGQREPAVVVEAYSFPG